MHPLLADPLVAAQIEAAVAPYRGLWPEAAIAAFREEMAATLATHPAAMRLLREAGSDVTDTSGEVRVTGSFAAPEPCDQRKTGSK